MTCDDVLDLVDAIAGGDEAPPELRAHIETCPRCAAALASARRLELTLSTREAPPAPPAFTSAGIARIRRERWRLEQRVDRLFNVAIAAAILLVIGGVVAILNVQSAIAVAAAVWSLASVLTGQAAMQAQPVVA